MRKIFLLLPILFSFIIGYSQPTNIDFGTGTLNGWSFKEAKNIDSYFMTNGTYSVSTKYSLMMPGVLDVNNVPLNLNSPLGGKFMRIGNTSMGGRSYNLRQTFKVDTNSTSLAICYALVTKLESHYCNNKPYFDFVIKDSLGNEIGNSHTYITDKLTNCINGDPFIYATNYDYKNWTKKTFSLQDYIGTNITVEFIASGCTDSTGTHPMYAYVDASVCGNIFSPNILSVNSNTYNLPQSQNNILVCGTTTANITAPSGASSYSWTGTGITGLTTQSVLIAQPGSYQLVFNKASACSNITSVSFTIGAVPTLTISSPSNTVCESKALTMTASGATNYSWTPFFNDTTGNNTNFKAQHLVYLNTSTEYTVFGKDANGCVSTAQFSITVIPKPIVSVSGNTAICIGNSSTLIATGANTYTWTPGALVGSSITVSPAFSTIYTVSGEDAGTGCTATKNINVLVNRNIEDNYLNANICIGDSIIRTAIGATSYTWSNGNTTNTVILKPTTTTVYTLSGTSSCGVTQKTFTIGVNPLPNIIANATQTFVCKGTSIKLFGSGGSNYTWSDNVTNNAFFTPTVTTTYTVIGTNNNGCKNSAVITLSVVPIATISISSSSNVLCLGQTTTLTASGANTYTWNTGQNTPTITVTPSNSGLYNYNLSGKNILGCTSSTFIAVSVYSASPTFSFASAITTVCAVNTNTVYFSFTPTNPYDIYSCGQPNTSCSANGLVLNPSPQVPTVYSITASNGCGAVTKTVQVVPQALPILTIAAPDSVCVGSTYSFSVSGADQYFQYLPTMGSGFSNINTFTNTANTTNLIPINFGGKYLNGCYSSIYKTVKVMSQPIITISGNNNITCASCNTNLIASGASSYSWNTGATTSSISVTPTSFTTYTVYGTDLNSCKSLAKTSIIVFDSLTICFSPSLGISAGRTVEEIEAADFNSDGKMDIVYSSVFGIYVCINSGNGNFLPPIKYSNIDGGFALAVGDLNNDGATDIVAPVGYTGYELGTFINDGNGVFYGPNIFSQYIGNYSAPGIREIVIGDLSGDGFAEIITGNIVNGIAIYKNTGIGTFTNIVIYGMNDNVGALSLGDLNHDNKLDIVASLENDTTVVLLNNGAGLFPARQKYSSGVNSVLCDVNADGNIDIVTGSNKSNLSILTNDGFGNFTQTLRLPFEIYPTKISSADFNNDGFSDLAMINAYTSKFVQVFINTKNGSFHTPVNYYFNAYNRGFDKTLIRDFNSDSKPDIISQTTGDSIVILLNSITPSLTITPQTNTLVCAGTNLVLTATGVNTYTWSGGISNGIAFSPIQTEIYTVIGTDNIGCMGSSVATVSVSPNLSVITTSSSICNGSNASIYANGADTYSWSTGANTSSVSVTPTTTTVYSVTGSDFTGCSYTKTVSILVDSCANVWPGDANSDGSADNLDILELGLHYNQTGLSRQAISNLWQAFQAFSWSGTITSGKNLNHSDCNGDGIINSGDTLAIYNNYGLTHAFKTAQTTTVNPHLSIVPDQSFVAKGTWGTSSIYLGDAMAPINTINGLAFTVNFDKTLIEPNSIYIEYINSFIDAAQNLHFRKLDFNNGKIFTATTHTLSNNANGFGKIAILHYQIKASLTTDSVLNIGLVQANQSNAAGLITPLTSGSGTLMAIGASVAVKELLNSANVSVSPNPTNGLLTVTSTTELQNIEVTTITGQVLLSHSCNSKSQIVQLQSFAEGIYFVKVICTNGMSVTKKLLVNR